MNSNINNNHSDEGNNIRNQLEETIGIIPCHEWLTACCESLKSSSSSTQQRQQVISTDEVLYQLLNTDLRSVVNSRSNNNDNTNNNNTTIHHLMQAIEASKTATTSCKQVLSLTALPAGTAATNNNATTTSVGHNKILLQIEELLDVSKNSEQRYSLVGPTTNTNPSSNPHPTGSQHQKQKRCLKMCLSHGYMINNNGSTTSSSCIIAMEESPITNISTNTLAGTKILLTGKVIVRFGVLMLNDGNTTVLGGSVQELVEIQKRSIEQAKQRAGVGVDPTIRALIGTNNIDDGQDSEEPDDEGQEESRDVQPPPAAAATAARAATATGAGVGLAAAIVVPPPVPARTMNNNNNNVAGHPQQRPQIQQQQRNSSNNITSNDNNTYCNNNNSTNIIMPSHPQPRNWCQRLNNNTATDSISHLSPTRLSFQTTPAAVASSNNNNPYASSSNNNIPYSSAGRRNTVPAATAATTTTHRTSTTANPYGRNGLSSPSAVPPQPTSLSNPYSSIITATNNRSANNPIPPPPAATGSSGTAAAIMDTTNINGASSRPSQQQQQKSAARTAAAGGGFSQSGGGGGVNPYSTNNTTHATVPPPQQQQQQQQREHQPPPNTSNRNNNNQNSNNNHGTTTKQKKGGSTDIAELPATITLPTTTRRTSSSNSHNSNSTPVSAAMSDLTPEPPSNHKATSVDNKNMDISPVPFISDYNRNYSDKDNGKNNYRHNPNPTTTNSTIQQMEFPNLVSLLDQLLDNREMYESYYKSKFAVKVQLQQGGGQLILDIEKDRNYKKLKTNKKYQIAIKTTFGVGRSGSGSCTIKHVPSISNKLIGCKINPLLIESYFEKTPTELRDMNKSKDTNQRQRCQKYVDEGGFRVRQTLFVERYWKATLFLPPEKVFGNNSNKHALEDVTNPVLFLEDA